jgi:hypothetical protein
MLATRTSASVSTSTSSNASFSLSLVHQSDYSHWLYKELNARRTEEVAAFVWKAPFRKSKPTTRELGESAMRMGFVFDDKEDQNNFSATLENDPELQAGLDAVERELATYQEATTNQLMDEP